MKGNNNMPRAIIYRTLKDSTYIVITDRFVFYFSSEFYKNKFSEEIYTFRTKINNKLASLYLMPVKLNNYADVIYYSKIEKRGFMVKDRITGGIIEWLGSITLDGQIKTSAKFKE